MNLSQHKISEDTKWTLVNTKLTGHGTAKMIHTIMLHKKTICTAEKFKAAITDNQFPAKSFS